MRRVWTSSGKTFSKFASVRAAKLVSRGHEKHTGMAIPGSFLVFQPAGLGKADLFHVWNRLQTAKKRSMEPFDGKGKKKGTRESPERKRVIKSSLKKGEYSVEAARGPGRENRFILQSIYPPPKNINYIKSDRIKSS